MNYNEMTLEELKDVARDRDVRIGNISRDKLIEKLKESESYTNVFSKDDFVQDVIEEEPVKAEIEKETHKSLLDTINSTLDDLDNAENEDDLYDDYEPLADNVKIQVRSISFGRLVYRSPTNNALFIWNNIGDTKTMTISEIIELNNARPDFLQKPRLILLNETAIKQFKLTHIYENVAQVNNLKALFKKSEDEISKAIDKALLVNMRDILISKVRTMYANKSLTDINVIGLLERKLQFDLTVA